jgi:hypothetical protein
MLRPLAWGAALVVAAMLILAGGRAAADEVAQRGTWFVVELSGSAFSRLGEVGEGAWQPLQPGESLAAGSRVRTGKDGNLVLANAVDRIQLSPDSEIELPGPKDGDAITRVIHWIGTAVFDVGKRPSPQFEVSTPYLVAVVKGTIFATTVSEAGSVVKVTDGVVGVAAAGGGGDSIDVRAGETASVSASDSDTVSPGDLPAASAPGQGGAAAVPSTDAPATAEGTTVESDSVTSAGGSMAKNTGGPGGGNGGGGKDDGATKPQAMREDGNGTGQGSDNDDDDDDDDDDDGDDHGWGCHGDGGCHHHHHGGWHHRG